MGDQADIADARDTNTSSREEMHTWILKVLEDIVLFETDVLSCGLLVRHIACAVVQQNTPKTCVCQLLNGHKAYAMI